MTKFKVGDKFIPRKPNNIWPFGRHWVEQMKSFWDRTMTIDEILVLGDEIHLVSECTSFNARWCEKAEERFPDIDKTIDWEQRRYEIAKECLAAQIAGNLNWNWSNEEVAKSAIEVADELIKQLQSS